MGVKEWRQILKDPVFNKIKSLDITGGEAVLHPKFNQLMQLLIEKMPKVNQLSLVTNGLATNRVLSEVEKLAKICREKNIDLSISVSIDDVGKQHDEIRGVDQAFKRAKATLLGLKQLKKEKRYDFYLGSAAVIQRRNLSNYKKIKKWLNKQKIKHFFQIVGFHDYYIKNLDRKNEVDFTPKDRKALIKFFKDVSQPRSLSDVNAYYWKDMESMYLKGENRTSPCPFLLDNFCIDSLGKVYYCFSERPIGSLNKNNTVSDIYYDPQNLSFRKKMRKTSCLKCNSDCFVGEAIGMDVKRYLWFRLTNRLWPRSI